MNPPIPSATNATFYGVAVDLRLTSGRRLILRNVTEIHYNYESPLQAQLGPQIAFESNVHCDGITYPMKNVKEFETHGETEKRPNFLPL